jgi:two-component system, OmpR family, phosphate regulon sensor histidine kinase PhoR
VAIAAVPLAALLEQTLRPLFSGARFQIAIRPKGGETVWNTLRAGTPVAFAMPMQAVPGWEILFANPPEPSGIDSRRLLWYGLIGLLVMMLAGGLAGTAHIARREFQLSRLQSDFVAGGTHEFKSPITSIRLLLERLAGGRLHTPQATAEYYGAIGRETDRLERLVNRVLESQKIQAGMRRYCFAAASIVALAESSIGRLRPQAEAKNISVKLEHEGEIPEMALDIVAINDALDNLIDNAIKYSPPETIVTVSIRGNGGYVTLEVCDHGAGIVAEDLPHIFARFYRGRHGDDHGVQGTGLGLALVKGAAEAHGGSVEAENVPDGGARFRMRLPIQGSSHGEGSGH